MSEIKNEEHPHQKWTTIVSADDRGFYWTLKELIQYKDLIYVLVKKELTYTFKQTALGSVWIILNPIISILVFALIFGYFAKIHTDGIPIILFYLTGGIMWNYFSNVFINSSNSLISNSFILNKVYIPGIIMPLSNSIAVTIKIILFVLVTIPFFTFYAITGEVVPNMWLIAFPFLLLLIFMLAMGMGMIFSALMVQYRDLGVLIPFLTSIIMFISPVLYPVSIVPEKLLMLYTINPLVGIIECFRYSLTGVGSFNPYMILNSTLISISIFLTGLLLFKKINSKIPDYI